LYQQGYGLGGYFRRFFRWLVPLAEKHVVPHLKTGVERIGREGSDTIAKLAADAIAGRNMRESSKQHVDAAIDNLKKSFEDQLEGKGKKKRRKIVFKKKKFKDIFS
jgi:hypothetical protein